MNLKRKNSRNEIGKSMINPEGGLDIEELEAETARLHKEVLRDRTNIESGDRGHKEKRTVSDNTR